MKKEVIFQNLKNNKVQNKTSKDQAMDIMKKTML
jgi:hypothetical protein